MPKVTVQPSGRQFSCAGKQSLLDAALAESVPLSFGCSEGTCGKCRARLVSGEIERIRHHDFAFREAEKLQGNFLLCSYTAATPELLIEATEASGADDIAWQNIQARIKKVRLLDEGIAVVNVQTPRSQRLRFLAGQNARLQLGSGAQADLPIASCPCDERNLEFHLRLDARDQFCAELRQAQSSTVPLPVTLSGPWGRCFDLDDRGATLCCAFDVSVAPMRSWIEQQLSDDQARRIHLSWHTQSETARYLHNLFRSWEDAFDAFAYQPSLTREKDDEAMLRLPEYHYDRVIVAGPTWYIERVLRLLSDKIPISRRHVHSTGQCPEQDGQ